MRASRKVEAVPVQDAAPDAPAPGQEQRTGSRGRNPNAEAALGVRIRAARIAANMSQADLGAAIGVTYQQVQKYEAGQDRVAASTLQGLAAAFGVHPGSFYGDEVAVPSGNVKPVREAMAVAANWQRITNPQTRKGLAKLIATLAEESQAKPESEG